MGCNSRQIRKGEGVVFVSDRRAGEEAPPPDTGTERATHSLEMFNWSYPASERSAPANANDATGPDNLAENPPAPEIPAKTGSIWDRLPPHHLDQEADEEARR